ncbi:gluconolaconase [Pseudomonas coronafaciens pv. porri]|uniref:Gluconolaconase n=1 Tax=Pseudomonas coronafaciens pv. porri TaxID=83964 RepID=A0ABR5JHJ6_9PSED|nr:MULTISPECIES: SMP-30/gluconolactonase/LRE family protein [Pseudomonas syringae group]KOP52232.1 gluconolaconase [Pseudomonas coronafaciens pv. porri]KOP56921.1 gluconolaconase [Pseudomonas coronafaciens pv. porri]KPY19116.1 Senescence marker protein-30 family protein [Pseudomonas coronafaciens pv. porri]MCF5804935.1 SMP-30/gluconolactonase/LRE family protein [Pseudomonas tremae]MCF5810759.1 SMP-30/gluconolactonase/LRE family protein [Pseudomonas tremae]
MNWLPVSEHRFKLAEGSFWDAQEQALYWVDIAGFLACRLAAGQCRQWRMPEPVSAFIPTAKGDALVTLASGIYRLDLTAEKTSLSLFCVADPTPGNRANEARCDARGLLWMGSMQNNIDAEGGDISLFRRSGGLFRVDADAAVTRLLDGQGIVNTLLWNADGSVLYSADTLDDVIYQYPLMADGTLGPRQVWAGVQSQGSPDGSAMDAEGYVWNARWGGGCLIRFAPDGSVDRVVELPVSHPTSCVFGGPDLQTLYVTSAAPGDAHGQFDGAVLRADVGVKGTLCQHFAG